MAVVGKEVLYVLWVLLRKHCHHRTRISITGSLHILKIDVMLLSVVSSNSQASGCKSAMSTNSRFKICFHSGSGSGQRASPMNDPPGTAVGWFTAGVGYAELQCLECLGWTW